ncbi:MAG: excinuclease ABC subunit UvrA [Pirellulales bacterium]
MVTQLEQEYVTSLKPARREQLERFRGQVDCPACGGSRLNPEARAVVFAGRGIHQIAGQSIGAAKRWFEELQVEADEAPIYEPLAREIKNRLSFLERVGLGYLGLDRSADTLSGGELQRVRLATSIGSGLVGVCYILDEPSIGLHPRDNDRLIESLRDLQEQGNTVLVVEHDEATMRAADLLIDMGPGAGSHGGRILAQGTPAAVAADDDSLTGAFLSCRRAIPLPTERRKPNKSKTLTLEGCTANNLHEVDVHIPLGLFVCVTGISGSGKSTLINGTLARALHRKLWGEGPLPGPFRSLRRSNAIKRLVRIDQSSIGRTPRSNPATYSGIYDEIRKLFAATKEARQRGYKTGRFSFNVKGGRCEECQGLGIKRIEMNFLPDIEVPCSVCGGARFDAATLDVRFRGRTIADVLNMPIEEAVEFFANVPNIAPFVKCLNDVGLGYLSLGQAGGTLSGGESQRIKLAAELGKFSNEPTLYLLDEPTTGLHFEDIRKLLLVLHKLVDQGHSVLVIEHNLDVVKTADYVIDMGPEGGDAGGRVVAVGTPEEITEVAESRTGAHLKPLLG